MEKPNFFYFIILLLLLVGCEQIQKATDVVTNPTARELYDRNFEKNDSVLLSWKQAFRSAQKDSTIVTLPYTETGVFSAEKFNVHSYNIQLREGEQLVVSLAKQPDSTLVFIELFEKLKDSSNTYRLLQASAPNSSQLNYTIQKHGDYKVTVQPEINTDAPFQLKIYTQPTYGFPVSGANNKNVQSFWAAPRDGGKRSHEGIDIFSARGTPLLAVTDGRISSTGNRGLGGKQVWLRDGLFGKTIYYAHLDSIAVREGQKVALGDTIGYVGNTGNAETTEPHLHFGIYKGSTGPLDPYPYIKKTEIPEITTQNKVTHAIVSKNKTGVHQGPSAALDELAILSKNDTLSVLGAHGTWFYIKANDSIKGFVAQSRVSELPSN